MESAPVAYPFAQTCPFTEPAELGRLRRNTPVAPVRMANGATAWLVTRRDDVRTVLGDDRFGRQAARAGAAVGGPFDFGSSVADPGEHARWRQVLNAEFGVANAEAMRPRVGELASQVLDELAETGRPADLMAGFAYVLPIRVLCAVFDLPEAPLRDWAETLRTAGNSMAAFGAAMGALHGTVTALVARRRGHRGHGLLAALLADGPDGEPALSDAEVVNTVLLLVIAGFQTTAVQFGNGFLALCRHPDQLALLKKDESLIGPAVEEILRYAQAGTGFAGATTTTVDVELAGVTIPAGSTVFASLDSAGRDETHVAHPQEFDVGRGSAGRHIAFGSGTRFCLGAPLARVELQEGFGRLLRRFPDLELAVDPDDVPMDRNMFSYFPRALPITW